jgi:hypothetical protein
MKLKIKACTMKVKLQKAKETFESTVHKTTSIPISIPKKIEDTEKKDMEILEIVIEPKRQYTKRALKENLLKK